MTRRNTSGGVASPARPGTPTFRPYRGPGGSCILLADSARCNRAPACNQGAPLLQCLRTAAARVAARGIAPTGRRPQGHPSALPIRPATRLGSALGFPVSRSIKPQLVYFIQQGDEPILGLKIGVAHDPERRLRQLQAGSASELFLISTRPGGTEEEFRLQRQFSHLNIGREWFEPSAALLREARWTDTGFAAFCGAPHRDGCTCPACTESRRC